MEKEKIYYFVFEGNDKRTDDFVSQFTDKEKAIKYAKTSSYNYLAEYLLTLVVVNKYRGEPDDEYEKK